MKKFLSSLSIFITVFSLGVLFAPDTVYAQTFVVTQASDDAGTCDSQCSLREAIIAANADSDADTITIDESLNSSDLLLSLSSQGVDTEADGDLDITTDMIIQGNDSIIRADGNLLDRVIEVHSDATLTLSDVHVNGGEAAQGGGIYNAGSLIATNLMIEQNSTSISEGGGIYSSGTLFLADSYIQHNTSSGDGGGIYTSGNATLNNVEIQYNVSAASDGGGIYNEDTGTLNIIDSSISFNSAMSGSGGAIRTSGYSSSDSTVGLHVTNSSISDNSAILGGGITILGMAIVDKSTIANNEATGDGGGIAMQGTEASMLIENSTVSSNTANGDGGGIAVTSQINDLHLNHVTVAYNTADLDTNALGNGGGVYFGLDAPIETLSTTASIYAYNTDNSFEANNIYVVTPIQSGGYNVVGELNVFDTNFLVGQSDRPDQLDREISDILIEPLLNYGGDTETHAILSNDSIAVDLIPEEHCILTEDQRGIEREDGACDAGAYEFQYDGDSDNFFEADDCDDTDSSIYRTASFFVDADGDGIGSNSSSTICYGDEIPAGYSTTSTDQCDDDSSTQNESSYYADADNDGYAESSVVTKMCSSDVTTGYILTTASLGVDCDETDDEINGELEYQRDADGDGIADSDTVYQLCPADADGYILSGTSRRGTTIVDLTTVDPRSAARYAALVESMTGLRNGIVRVELTDNRVLNHHIFSRGNRVVKVAVLPTSGVGVAIAGGGKSMRIFNPYTGEILDTVRISTKKKKARSITFLNLRNGGNKAVVTLKKKKRGMNTRVVIVSYSIADLTMEKRSAKKVTNTRKVRVNKTMRASRPNRIQLRSRRGVTQAILKVKRNYRMNVL